MAVRRKEAGKDKIEMNALALPGMEDLETEDIAVSRQKYMSRLRNFYAEPLKFSGSTQLGGYTYLEGPEGALVLEQLCREALRRKAPVVCDLETTGRLPFYHKILLFAFTFTGRHAYVFSPETIDPAPFLKVLEKCPVSNHFIKFDYQFVKKWYGVSMNIDWDTQVTNALATAGLRAVAGDNRLQTLSKKYLGVSLNKEVREEFLSGEWRNNRAIAYAAEDVLATWKLIPVTKKVLAAAGQCHVWEEIEKPLIPVLAEMELEGVRVDIEKVRGLRADYQNRLDEAQIELGLLAPGLNFGSNPQMLSWLKSQNIEPEMKLRKNGKETPTADEEALLKLIAKKKDKRGVIAKVLECRELHKMLSSFLIPWSTPVSEGGAWVPETGCIHASFTQIDTDTGRMTAKSPNLQQVPKESDFREVFIPGEGEKMVCLDYSQYELRVLAELSGDPKMSKIFIERQKALDDLAVKLRKRGFKNWNGKCSEFPELVAAKDTADKNDMHSQTAITMFKIDATKVDVESPEFQKKRSAAKSISFGIPYGSGPAKIAEKAKQTETQIKRLLEEYFKTFRLVKIYIEKTKRQMTVSMDGGGELAEALAIPGVRIAWSESLGGRRRFYHLPGRNMDPDKFKEIQARIGRQAVNHRIQGSNADVTKLALIELFKVFREDARYSACRIRLPVHDEIVTTCPAELAEEVLELQRTVMIEASKKFVRSVPTEVSGKIGDHWMK